MTLIEERLTHRSPLTANIVWLSAKCSSWHLRTVPPILHIRPDFSAVSMPRPVSQPEDRLLAQPETDRNLLTTGHAADESMAKLVANARPNGTLLPSHGPQRATEPLAILRPISDRFQPPMATLSIDANWMLLTPGRLCHFDSTVGRYRTVCLGRKFFMLSVPVNRLKLTEAIGL